MARLGFSVFVFSIVALCSLSSCVTYAADRFPPEEFPLIHYPEARSLDLTPRADEPNYRLPNNTVPVHYDVELTTNVHNGEYDFSGKVSIQIDVIDDTRTIVLHARQLTVTGATISPQQQSSAGLSYALSLSYDSEREFLSLTPQDASVNFRAGDKWTISLVYNGLLRKDNGGFYMSTYTDENKNIRYLATTQFESTDARHAFPCYDEPAKRATFTITINHDSSYYALSNMPKDDSKSITGRTVFKTTLKMSTYLVAFIVSDFKYTEGVLNSLPQRIYSRPGSEEDQEWALVSGMLIIQRLAKYYGVDFAFPKLDQVAIPDFAAGAMENWGLVTYREEYLLYNKDKSTVNTQTNIATTVAHEYTHQWFGNLVAIKWWTYLWLKEGFATLFEFQATDAAYPEWDIYQYFHISHVQRALNMDGTTRPMTYYIQKPNSISSLYDSISYSKGGSVLRMWQHALTDTVFRQGLNNYLERNKFSAADETDLFKGIQDAAKEKNFAVPAQIEDMMASWTRQRGYPLLKVTRNYEDGSFTISQEAYFRDSSKSSNDLWYVPINAAVESNPDFRQTSATHYMLKINEVTVNDVKPDKNEWLILNKQSTGLYRIMYDERNYGLIIGSLINKIHKIHPQNRAQLLSDAHQFSVSNRLKHDILMEMLRYLPNEDQYAPWSTANTILTSFNSYLRSDGDYGNFKKYVAMLVENIYEKLGVNDIPGEHHLQKFTRSITINLACMAGIESCIKETRQKLVDHVQNHVEIEPNLLTQVYCNGLRQADDKEYNFVFDELMDSEDQAKRRLMISSLGCAEKKEHLQKFVQSSTDMSNKLRTQERITILSPVYARSSVGLMTCIDFLKQNWKEYGNLTPGFGGSKPLHSDIVGMSGYVLSKDEEAALLELVNIVKESEYVNENLEQSVKNNVEANFDWLDDNRNKIMGYLANYYREPDSSSATIHTATISVTILALLTRLS